jgi:hypothetical protein
MQYEQGGTPQRSAATYDFHPSRAAFPPQDMAAPDAARVSAFRDDSDWTLNDAPDVHDEPFEDIGADLAPVDEPLPPNVIGGNIGSVDADFGEYSNDDAPAPNIVV